MTLPPCPCSTPVLTPYTQHCTPGKQCYSRCCFSFILLFSALLLASLMIMAPVAHKIPKLNPFRSCRVTPYPRFKHRPITSRVQVVFTKRNDATFCSRSSLPPHDPYPHFILFSRTQVQETQQQGASARKPAEPQETCDGGRDSATCGGGCHPTRLLDARV